MIYILVAVAIVQSFLFLRPEWISNSELSWVVVLGLGTIFSLVRWFRLERSADFPLVPLVSLFYFGWFVLPVFNDYQGARRVYIEDITSETLSIVVFGLSTLTLGWFGVLRFLKSASERPSVKTSILSERIQSRVLLCAFFFQVGFVALDWSDFVASLVPSSVVQLFNYCHRFSLFVAAEGLRSRLPRVIKLTWIALLALDLLTKVTSGLVAEAAFWLAPFVFWHWWRFRNSFALLVAGLSVGLLLVSTQEVKKGYRSQVWSGDASSMSEIKKLAVWEDSFRAVFEDDGEKSMLDSMRHLGQRSSAVAVLQEVRELCPDVVPYEDGRTLLPILVGWIPRAFWPDKPVSGAGNEFGKTFGLLDENDDYTSMNTPWLIELYWNFGDAGIVLGFLVVGIIFGVLEFFYNGYRLNVWSFGVAGSIFWPVMATHESALSLSFSGLPLILVFYALLKRFLLSESGSLEVEQDDSTTDTRKKTVDSPYLV